MDFKTGDAVEVSTSDEGFRGAWYEAKIVRSMPRLNRYTVVYDSIVEETDASNNLRETVDAANVRPRPPLARDSTFAIQQHVDAFFNDGWWEGIVSGMLRTVRRKKYSVNFPITGDVMEFLPSELRPRLDWVNGEWVNPQTQVTGFVIFVLSFFGSSKILSVGVPSKWYRCCSEAHFMVVVKLVLLCVPVLIHAVVPSLDLFL